MYREFQIDVPTIVTCRLRTPHGDALTIRKKEEIFRDEEQFLEDCEKRRVQALRIVVPDGMSFEKISRDMAMVHFYSFLQRYEWLSS